MFLFRFPYPIQSYPCKLVNAISRLLKGQISGLSNSQVRRLWVSHNRELEAMRGSSLRLTCSFSGDPLPGLTWTLNHRNRGTLASPQPTLFTYWPTLLSSWITLFISWPTLLISWPFQLSSWPLLLISWPTLLIFNPLYSFLDPLYSSPDPIYSSLDPLY